MITAQLLLNALALGAAYALVALGFVLVLNAVGAVNFAQGDLVAAGGYAAIGLAALLPPSLLSGDWPGVLLLPGVVLVMGGIGWLMHWVIYDPLRQRPIVSVFVSTIALGLMLRHGLAAFAGAAPQAGPPLVQGEPLLLPLPLALAEAGAEAGAEALRLDPQSLAVIGAALGISLALFLFLEYTWTGRRFRAAAQDPLMATAIGIPVRHMAAIAFALAAALAGTAGLLLANRYFVTPEEGSVLMLKAYIAVTIGGWGRFGGAVLGALLIALFEVLGSAWLSYPVAEALLYLSLLLILMLRPEGLLGERAGVRA